ncbi:unannotated protein [freshwater metagenome]|uniref:Unannotated protein n=1 Tax=freshwater metagenome TaxID=449393 RepID=A0A6J7HBD9_9ZZZZ|nr:hypothetical protein [Actinomycetota bacterium]
MRSGITRPAVLSSLAICSVALIAAPHADAARRAKVRTCDSTVQRVQQRGAQPLVLHAATKITSRGRSCDPTRRTINAMLQRVGGSSATPPAVCCTTSWYADDRDYWTKTGWAVRHAAGNPADNNGQRWWITKGKTSIRFTRWM